MVTALRHVRGQPFEIVGNGAFGLDVGGMDPARSRPLCPDVTFKVGGLRVPLAIYDHVRVYDDHSLIEGQRVGVDPSQYPDEITLRVAAEQSWMKEIDLDHTAPSRTPLEMARAHHAGPPIMAELLDDGDDIG